AARSGPPAARLRAAAALRDLGPGLGDMALRCCCRMQGLETAEREMGWSARSGKIVLRIALQRLKRHFDAQRDGPGALLG
ncbi:helix-turn-helix domain-containing protein, partial [Aquicoccus sp. SCR17]|nr:helix-turn-helix domain-containing protein [Carideicomes alvinocaridis]